MKKSVNLIYPHQLFKKSPLVDNRHEVYLIEEHLFFRQYKFHKQKIAFHRASMKYYQQYLQEKGIEVHYIESGHELSNSLFFDKEIKKKDITEIHVINPTDNWLEKKLRKACRGVKLEIYDDPQFLNTIEELSSFFKPDKKSFFQTAFYKGQRKKLGLLLDDNGEPTGGQWTFDSENRKKYPKSKSPPAVHYPFKSNIWEEVINYTCEHFGDNPGETPKNRLYPITHKEAEEWLDQFLNFRFFDFGAYEDAIVQEHSILNHSVLSPLLNSGLVLPNEVIEKTIAFGKKADIPINSIEGFIRQIIGWREFMRGMYLVKGSYSRTYNFWKFKRKIPESFYKGTTGIDPVDSTIKKVLATGYCHHIERLMILGNFMLLCEFDPDEVYRWFMELFIDAYDWVMVPNVYGMSQFADGGTFATKPYIGGSNYIRKMSNYKKGDWEEIWDGLFWLFISKNKNFFASNPRTSMLVHSFNRMPKEKREAHIAHAEQFIESKILGK
ncbi:MAG: cryptochrome/photolyase family protein [Cyclobacteriaceae bacterium]|nr:cryptochrome/photolyase family protein [Cyclobacteriaceae bacterium]